MKKMLIGLVTLGSIISATASALEINDPLNVKLSNTQVEEDKTYFETLGDLYSKGVRPDISKLTNKAWAGRCFMKANPNEPKAGGYVFRVKKGADVGPIGAGNVSYEAAAYYGNDLPDAFDHMELKDVLENLSDSGVPFASAKILTDSISIAIAENATASIKLSGKYLVVEGRETDPKAGDIDVNGVFGRCYYFIPEYIND